ncbi:zf-TFIIB domain-containing protein [Microbacterium sp. 10M-3C3]|jgi:Zn-finger nucleic acid-binding protein|uniref:TFIIB-type zinc ribbon-containing protein n=1 Tax=Microbacterium sp. 10M-3C3 TaxID=2483401 RepID=UPI000F640EE9|nr:zf-TFIIB domain-containing protein [Microbacterium sp. 10M-3C3]
MKCPIDGNTLVLSDRTGIEIDYCPECRGVWLDRGELDKIIERSLTAPPPPAQQTAPYPTRYDGHGSKHGSQSRHDNNEGQNGRRRGGWLGDLFD